MAVIRVEKRSNFTVLDNTAIRDKSLSLKALGLYVKMMSLPPEWNYSVAGLAAICKEGMSAIRSCLKELEEAGYLVRERKNNEKGYFVYSYTLYEMPQTPHIENSHTVEEHTEEAHAEKAHAEEAHTENRAQLSTKELKKKELKKDLLKKDIYKGISDSDMSEILDERVESEDLKLLYVDYAKMREEVGAPLTKRSLSLLIDRAERLSDFNTSVQALMIEEALIQGWKNIYPITKQVEDKGINRVAEEHRRILFGNDL